MARINNHRQMAQLLHRADGGQVECVARVRLERADTALAQNHLLIAARHDVLRAHQPLLDGRRQTALKQNRLANLTQLFQQVEILHVARADLNAVHLVHEGVNVVGGHQLGHDGQPGLLAGMAEHVQPLVCQSLEGVRGRARLERTTAQHRRARVLHRLRNGGNLLVALHGAGTRHNREFLAADNRVPDFDFARRGMERAVCLLERLGNLHDALDAVEGFQLVGVNAARVASQTKDGHLRADNRADGYAAHNHGIGDGVDFLLGRALLQDDNHGVQPPASIIIGSKSLLAQMDEKKHGSPQKSFRA